MPPITTSLKTKILVTKKKFEARVDTGKLKAKGVRNQVRIELKNRYEILGESNVNTNWEEMARDKRKSVGN